MAYACNNLTSCHLPWIAGFLPPCLPCNTGPMSSVIVLFCALHREVAVRCIADAVEAATTYSEYQLILEISMTLANDHGEPTSLFRELISGWNFDLH